MRLIDADSLSFYCNYDYECTGTEDKCKKCPGYVCSFRDVQEIPTAFDVDKVVKELENESKGVSRGYLGKDGNKYHKHYKAVKLSKAVEIVKQGGL